MSTETEKSKMTVEELATRFRSEMIPLTSRFSYFLTLPIADEDLRQYLNDPIAAISPVILAALPPLGLGQPGSPFRYTGHRSLLGRVTGRV